MSEGELNVAVQVKIFIDDPVNLSKVKASIEKVAKINKVWEDDIGFGIKILKVNFLLSDSEGGMEKFEEKLRGVPHISEFEVENVARV